MIAHFLLIISEILTIKTRNNFFRTIFPVSSYILTNIYVSAVPTLLILLSIQRRHLKMGDFFSKKKKELSIGTYQSGRFEMSHKLIQ